MFSKVRSRATLLAIAFALAACSHSSSSAPIPKQIVPGETFTVLDASLSGYNLINFVIRNNMNYSLPSFDIDYKLECDVGETKFGNLHFYSTTTSNEQITRSISVGAKASYCTLTLLAVRPSSYTQKYYEDWTGTYVIQVN